MEAYSKCPFCRHVFPLDQENTLLQEVLSIQLGRIDNKKEAPTDLIVHYTLGNRDFEQALQDLTSLLALLLSDSEKLKKFRCRHVWTFKPGQKSSIGCGHGAPEHVCNSAQQQHCS